MKKIHIVGCSPRSGTTLLAEMMGACFGIDSCSEHETSLVHDRSSLLRRLEGCRIRLGKNPGDLKYVKPYLRFDSNMHVICMVRDPRDVIVSVHGKSPDKYWVGLKYWVEFNKRVSGLENHPNFEVVRYEDIVADPDAIQARLSLWLPWLSTLAPFGSYHRVAKNVSKDSIHALGGVRAVSKESVGRWRSHLGRIAKQVSLHGSITPSLIHWGYEQDDSWEKLLDDVPFDDRLTDRSEYFSAKERSAFARRYRRAALRAFTGL